MRYLMLAVALILSMALPSRGATNRVTQATDAMIDAVVTRVAPGEDVPPRPPISDAVRAGVANELWNNSSLQSSYQMLAAKGSNHDWFRAIEELEEGHAAWCLASGLCHPSDDVRIRCAKALGRLRNPAPARWVLEVADAFAVPKSGSEDATLHGIFQHALADTLNILTSAKIELKDGQDPEGLRAALPKWKRALRERSGPIIRSDAARNGIAALQKDLKTFSITVTVVPMPEGQWDPKYELQSITLAVTPLKRTERPLNPAGRPAEADATITPEQAGIVIDALADIGLFDDGKSVCTPRVDRHFMIEVGHGSGSTYEKQCLSLDWRPEMFAKLDQLHDALDGESFRIFNQLVAPITPQRREWEKQATK